MALLNVEHLCFIVPARTVLEGVDLSVDAGEIHALIGANGSGKSTLANLIMGCEGYRPHEGQILFQDHPIHMLPIHERASLGITMAWQEPARFEGLSVRDYLNLGSHKVTGCDASTCLKRVGLEPEAYLGRMVDKTLSGGERKRIELASVLTLNPRLVILDEPTAGIDLLSIGEIISVIRGFRAGGAAVLLITHHEEILHMADRASLLSKGQIVCSGDSARIAVSYRALAPAVPTTKDKETQDEAT